MVRWAPTEVPKLQLESADGDDAESVRWRLRERVAVPDGDDGGVASAGQPPGVVAATPSSVRPAAWNKVCPVIDNNTMTIRTTFPFSPPL